MGGKEGAKGESTVDGVNASIHPVLIVKGTGGDDV